MGAYKPLKIAGFETGLVQEREDFLLVSDAFPVIENAYIWREKIMKKRGAQNLGRLRRILTAQTLNVTGASPYVVVPPASPGTNDVLTYLALRATEADAQIQCANVVIVFDRGNANETKIEDASGLGTLTLQGGSGNTMSFTSGTINYVTGAVSAAFGGLLGGVTVDITFGYYPALPITGLRTRERSAINDEEVIGFDTKYAYTHTSGTNWQELLAGTTWSGLNSDFFWSTNYWFDSSNNKLLWVTNFKSGATGDPMRYYNGITWTDFQPFLDEAELNKLYTARILIPYRGRMLALNTFEGTVAGGFSLATQNRQRIRWSQIGTPIDTDSWKNITGKGNFLDIPTSQNIVSAGFVRDNLVIYCERSTWQLRYVGRKITPYVIERVNDELGAESTFSAVQFDTSLVGIGDKRIVSCDSFKAEPIDIKIPDFAINIENENLGHQRVHGIRDIQKRLCYWSYPSNEKSGFQETYPNRVLLYNYENESWSIFKDSITALGYAWVSEDPTWESDIETEWEGAGDQTWSSGQADNPVIISGNQQGYTHRITTANANQQSLQIKAITGNITTATEINSPNHNLEQGAIIEIVNIPTATGYASLNGSVFSANPTDADKFLLYTYNSEVDDWIAPQLDASATYLGCGEIVLRDNFRVLTKKFHEMDEGSQLQIGYVDALISDTDAGEINFNTYVDYLNSVAANTGVDPFFNTRVATTSANYEPEQATAFWHRIFCPVRGAFLQCEFTMNNAQMAGAPAVSEFILHALIVWKRSSGRLV